jgi:phosphoglycerate dehydrogenase-like enzyme
MAVRIVFHGTNAIGFHDGFADLLGQPASIACLPDELQTDAQRQEYAAADVIIGMRFDAALPRPERLRLFHVPAAGYDAVDFAAVPPGAVVCNCFGHETAIAEFVMAALLQRCVPLADADRQLRRGEWTYWAGAPERAHPEFAGSTLGLLGFGHIGKAVAKRAKAFDINIHVANRSPVASSDLVDRYYPLSELREFYGNVDAVVVSVPLAPDTRGMVGQDAFGAMRPDAVLINVACGPVVDEQALYDALRNKRIGGAVIDTWYQYPTAAQPVTAPGSLPFADLSNIVMTPHMSGWTKGTIRRRQTLMADNIGRRMRGEACENVLHGA